MGFNYSLNNVVAVAATRADDKLAFFSNYGKESVHVAAPGVNIKRQARQLQQAAAETVCAAPAAQHPGRARQPPQGSPIHSHLHAPSPAPCPTVAACSTWFLSDQSYETISGTSMACPLVAGMAAVLFAAKPGITYLEVK